MIATIATAFITGTVPDWHCAEKKLYACFLDLCFVGPQFSLMLWHLMQKIEFIDFNLRCYIFNLQEVTVYRSGNDHC